MTVTWAQALDRLSQQPHGAGEGSPECGTNQLTPTDQLTKRLFRTNRPQPETCSPQHIKG
jgi:hypothetical protein